MLSNESPDLTFPIDRLAVEPWPDPVIDELGHDPRSAYVERFWLGVLGPSTVWLLRRLADQLDQEPAGFDLDLTETARALGVGMRGGRHSPFMRSVERVCRFGAGRWQSPTQLAVRRKLAPLTRGQLERLSPTLQAEHDAWTRSNLGVDSPGGDVEVLRQRSRQLALSLLELGEDPAATERQLHRWRFHPAMAHDAVRWAVHAQVSDPTDAADPDDPAGQRRDGRR
jgi:hypothetical protein